MNEIGSSAAIRALNLVPIVMKATLGFRPPVQVFGDDYPTPDGTCIRDYIHVEDLADAHVRGLAYLAAGGATEALNVGTGQGSSVLDVIRATERVSGRTVPHEIVARRAGDPVSTFADPERVARVLGWAATRGLDDILSFRLGAEWVVLSACNTAAADGRGEEALSGLARAFLYAGARSLLVTHWAVESDSARLLTTATFEHQAAHPQAPRAESLRQAMLRLMAQPRYAHPAYWAPFALVGEGGR